MPNKGKVVFGIAGHGIATRMYEPVIARCPGLAVKRLSLPRVDPMGWLERHNSNDEAQLRACSIFLVSVPPYAHEAYGKLALAYHVPVICEKPVGLSEAVPNRLADAAHAKNVYACANYQLRFDPCIRFLRQTVTWDEVSRLEIIYKSDARLRLAGAPQWYKTPGLGGGIKFSLLSHLAELVHWFGLDVESVRVLSASPVGSATAGNDMIQLEARLTTGALLVISCSGLCRSQSFTVKVEASRFQYVADLKTGTIFERFAQNGLSFSDESLIRSQLGIWKYCFWQCMRRFGDDDLETAGLATMSDSAWVHGFLERVQTSLDALARANEKEDN